MKNRSFKAILRCAAVTVLAAICILTFSGCKSLALSPSNLALTEVGTVGGNTVYYEELYFLAKTYDGEDVGADELWELINQNIVTNYAMLKLAEDVGVEYDEKQLSKDTQKYIDDMIDESFGKRKNYISALKESGMTDHYVRFMARCELLYSKVANKLALDGKLLADEDEVISYVKENFVRTWHLMIANEKGEDAEANRQKAEAALADLRAGKTTMYKLIGGALNDDLLIPSTGYTFGKGYMEKTYEDAAFALEVGEFSEVISAKGELANGEYLDCFYVIERLELTEDDIKEDYESIYAKYASSAVVDMLDEVKTALTFLPNDFCKSLDVKDLEPVGAGSDVWTTLIVCGVTVLVGGAVLTVILVHRTMKKRSAQRLAIKRAALQNAKGKK